MVSSSWKTASGLLRVVPQAHIQANCRHYRGTSSLMWARPLQSGPWGTAPWRGGTSLSTLGLSCRWPVRAGPTMKPRCWGVLRKAQGEHRMQGPSRIAVAGKLPVARHWDIPSKKAKAASSPAMTPSRFWYCMAHTPASSRFGTGDDAKATEGSLRRIARRGVLRAHCGPAGLAPIALDHKASQ